MTPVEAIRHLRAAIAPIAGDLAQREAETTLMSLLDCDRQALYLEDRPHLSPTLEQTIFMIASRRCRGMPLAYAVGSTYFHSAELRVTPEVLIPRPDTETLVELLLKHEREDGRHLLDLGTGSGALTAIVLRHRPSWQALATDISFRALRVAAQNTAGLPVTLLCADKLSALHLKSPTFDIIVSNPPYISHAEMETLDAEVIDYEPRRALDGGYDGLDFYRYLATHAGSALRPGGRLYLEIGAGQQSAVCALLHQQRWHEVSVARDLGGRPRAVRAVAPRVEHPHAATIPARAP